MAIPDESLSSEVVRGDFVGAASMESSSAFVHRDGPLELQNPILGIKEQVWSVKIVGNTHVYISAPNYPERVLISGVAITAIDIAFDRNANLYYTWVDQDICYLYWYNPLTGNMFTTVFGTDVTTPKLDMDDKRDSQSAKSDVIFAYVKKSDGGLYYRQQRDRFEVERLLSEGPHLGIEKMGMNDGWRLQFKMANQQ